MELIDAIKNRRSIRHFIDKDITNDIISDILNSGRLAPSAKNNQPWIFYVVKGDLKNKISFYLENFANKTNEMESVLYTSKVIKESNTLILIYKGKSESNVNDYLSIGACIENMLLCATNLDIGSLWIRHIVYVSDDISKLLNIDDKELVCAVCLGYTNHHPNSRPRKELKDMVTFL